MTIVVTVMALAAVGCGSAAAPSLRGQRVEVLAVWTGTEQNRFGAVLRAFEARTGATVVYTTAGHTVPETLDARLIAGRPPDVAFLPQPGVLDQYARAGRLVPLDAIAGTLVARNYDDVWRRLGMVDGRLYGVWFKAAEKSLVWYNVGLFERAGVVPPRDVNGLETVARTLTASGVPAFSVGGADGWTLADWFENLYLRLAGPARYDLLAQHRLAWTDPSVVQALTMFDTILSPSLVAGGAAGAAGTSYEQSVRQTFATPPAAAMVFEGDFVLNVIEGSTTARPGVDADVFPFPGVGASGPEVVGGGDAAVVLRRSRAGDALVRFLATPEAGAIWAAEGGFISPNVNVDLSAYPDTLSRSLARDLLDAGDGFRFGLSDLAPVAFGGTNGQGLEGELLALLSDRDVAGTAARLQADADAAYGP